MELSTTLPYAADPRRAAEEAAALERARIGSALLRERIAVYREAGVTMLNVQSIGPDPVKLVETVKNRL
ncbi:hypothetical protein [Streptomyces sp. S186]|uniref:hypothetical protein n=1 Tax=Streptomyces sp. S186 TaxID=3434395 RepID=UPI003F677B83